MGHRKKAVVDVEKSRDNVSRPCGILALRGKGISARIKWKKWEKWELEGGKGRGALGPKILSL